MTQHSFGDVGFRLQKQELKSQLYKLLTDLRTLFRRHSFAARACEQFRQCLERPENNDINRLPRLTIKKPPRKYKQICHILLTVDSIIASYWNFCNGNKGELTNLSRDIIKLGNIIKEGL